MVEERDGVEIAMRPRQQNEILADCCRKYSGKNIQTVNNRMGLLRRKIVFCYKHPSC